jgi:aminoglycoside/choline kinase family phosphotransferase
MTRSAARQAFLETAGWAAAERAPLAGDASARSYMRLTLATQSAVLMDTPLGAADDPAQFVMIANHLTALGLSAPRCIVQDLAQGFLLLEDFGDGVFAWILQDAPHREIALYAQAVKVLHHLQSHPAPHGLPNLSTTDWADAAMLSLTRYAAGITGQPPKADDLHTALAIAMARYSNGPRVLILRDYHAENLMLLPDRTGLAQVGLLDFQLAQMGQPCYDLVSLLQDARRDVAPTTQAAMRAEFLSLTGQLETDFAAAYACFGAQRALRILGIFAQLCTHQGKPQYLPLIPRVWQHLQQNLAHPALQDLAKICARDLPQPSPAALQHLRSTCQTCPS